MADRYLVDTGVFVRWYIEQDGYQDALALQTAYVAGGVELETVDFVRYELGDVLRRKGLLMQKITADDYVAAARSLDDLGVAVHVTTADVLAHAADLAAHRMISFFDALLLAWSLELGTTVLTTDKRLCSAAAGTARTQLLSGWLP
ncbi:MAG: type II toxin-antitoxin system VapC family toxin [Pseudonocardia sp.]